MKTQFQKLRASTTTAGVDAVRSRIDQRAAVIVSQTLGQLRGQIAAHKKEQEGTGLIPRDLMVHADFSEWHPGLSVKGPLIAKVQEGIASALAKDGHRVIYVEVVGHPNSVYAGVWVDNVDPLASYEENKRRLASKHLIVA